MEMRREDVRERCRACGLEADADGRGRDVKEAADALEAAALAVADGELTPEAQRACAALRATATATATGEAGAPGRLQALETAVAELQARRLLAAKEQARTNNPDDAPMEADADLAAALWELASAAGVALPRRADAADVVRRVRASPAAKMAVQHGAADDAARRGDTTLELTDEPMSADDDAPLLSPSAAAVARSAPPNLVAAAEALDAEYAERREMVLTRLRVTLDAFLHARRLSTDPKRKAEAAAVADKGFAELSAKYGDATGISLNAAADARARDVALLGGITGHDGVASTAVKRVRIGRVPDRGGRPGSEPPSRVELGWGGGRGGGGRGGGGRGGGGGGRGRGGRGSRGR